ncbi:MAG: hypothetical protein HFH27_12055 [Clostridiaceae bacterium]|nr:hypothetical protein [Clostridiaceae bacterium]MCI9485172.1 hypothetical protein [Clostridiaceae bacterium]
MNLHKYMKMEFAGINQRIENLERKLSDIEVSKSTVTITPEAVSSTVSGAHARDDLTDKLDGLAQMLASHWHVSQEESSSHTGTVDLSGASLDPRGQARAVWMGIVMKNLLELTAELMQLPDADARVRAVRELHALISSVEGFYEGRPIKI